MSGVPSQLKPQILTPTQEIVPWSQGICLWKRDTLRRLCPPDALTEDNFPEWTKFCRQQYHPRTVSADGAKKREPLAATHTPADGSGDNVALKCVKDVLNVNGLADGQMLKFRKAGLSAVFGGNSSVFVASNASNGSTSSY